MMQYFFLCKRSEHLQKEENLAKLKDAAFLQYWVYTVLKRKMT
jgi:hypothetical protein